MAGREVRTRLTYQLDDRGIRQATQGMQRLGASTSRMGQAFSAARIPIIGSIATLGAFGIATFGAVAAIKATTSAAISFESAFAGVRKTIDASEAEFATLEKQFRSLSLEIPVAVNELLKIGELGGQLGIAKEGIIGFTDTVARLQVATTLTGEAAGTFLARFANIMGLTSREFERVGSTLVELGNNAAATEGDIAAFALRIAGAGRVVGLSADEVLGLSSALASVGLRAQAGGNAVSRTLINMANSIAEGGRELEIFAALAGTSVGEFAELFEQDASQALQTFIAGLHQVDLAGGNVFKVLDALGLGEIRVRDALLRAAGAQGLFNEQLGLARDAYIENTALLLESERRFETTESQITLAKNALHNLAIEIGQTTLPAINTLAKAVAEGARTWTDYFTAIREGSIGAKAAAVAGAGFDILSFLLPPGVTPQNPFRQQAEDAAEAFKNTQRQIRIQAELAREMEFLEEGGMDVGIALSDMNDESEDLKDGWEKLLASLEKLLGGTDEAATKSLPNFTAELINSHPAVQALTLAIEQQEAVLEAERIAIQGFQDGLRAMQQEIRDTQGTIRDLSRELSDAQQKLNEFLRPRLKGQGALEERIFQLQGVLRRIQLAELQGGPVSLTEAQGGALGGLALDPESIQRALRSLQLQLEDLTADPLRKLQQAAEGDRPELTFEQALAGLQEQQELVKNLQGALDAENESLREQQRALVAAQDALREMNRSLQQGQTRLRELEKQQSLVTDALQFAFKWYFQDRDAVMEYGGEAARQGKIVDESMRKLLDAIILYSTEQSANGIDNIRSLRAEAENAVVAIANAVVRANEIMAGMPSGPSTEAPSGGATAHGGIFTRPTNILVGEAGPEAVVPLGASAGGGTTIIIQSQAFMGSRSEARAFARQIAEILNEEQRLRQPRGSI